MDKCQPSIFICRIITTERVSLLSMVWNGSYSAHKSLRQMLHLQFWTPGRFLMVIFKSFLHTYTLKAFHREKNWFSFISIGSINLLIRQGSFTEIFCWAPLYLKTTNWNSIKSDESIWRSDKKMSIINHSTQAHVYLHTNPIQSIPFLTLITVFNLLRCLEAIYLSAICVRMEIIFLVKLLNWPIHPLLLCLHKQSKKLHKLHWNVLFHMGKKSEKITSLKSQNTR